MGNKKRKVIDEIFEYANQIGHRPQNNRAGTSFEVAFSVGENDFVIVTLQVQERILSAVELVSRASQFFEPAVIACMKAFLLELNSQILENRLSYGYEPSRDAIMCKADFVYSITDMQFNLTNYTRLYGQVTQRLLNHDALLAAIIERCVRVKP